MPISATARFTSNILIGVLMERFQQMAKQTAKFPRIPVSVVKPSITPTVSTTPLTAIATELWFIGLLGTGLIHHPPSRYTFKSLGRRAHGPAINAVSLVLGSCEGAYDL